MITRSSIAVSRSGRLVAVLGSLLSAVTLALGPSPANAGSVTFPTRPASGTCHQWRYLPAQHSYGGRAVSCNRRHDVVTIAVPNAPRSLVGLSATEIDTLAATTCEPLMLKRLGRSPSEREMSAYHFLFGRPTAAQIAEGAHWVRCDLALGYGRNLSPLPARLPHPILGKHLDDDTERCLTASHVETTCSRRHAYRPIGTVRFGRVAYPSAAQFEDVGSRRCARPTRYFTWSSPDRWAAGDRMLVCYAKTRK